MVTWYQDLCGKKHPSFEECGIFTTIIRVLEQAVLWNDNGYNQATKILSVKK